MQCHRAAALALLTVSASAFAQAPAATTERPSTSRVLTATDVRQGPGSRYAPTVRLLPGAPLRTVERREQWALVESGTERGWIPAYSIASTQASDSPAYVLRRASKSLLRSLTEMVRGGGPTQMKYTTATLGIRGFAEAFATHRGEKLQADAGELWEPSGTAVRNYDRFLESRFAGRDWAALKRRLPLDTPAPLPDPDSDKLGGALAAAITRQHALRRDPAAEAYLGSVAMLVAESSHAFDIPVRVYILRSPQVLGFVTPHGLIFVSDGALRAMRSEAEFAFFVGHELAHVAFGHGARRLQRDESRQREQSAFTEMEGDLGWEERTDDRYVRTSRELTQMADEIHDYLLREANDGDELEADRWGLIYAARAGYVPEAAADLLVRITAPAPKAAAGDTQLLWRGTRGEPRIAQSRTVAAAIAIPRVEFRGFEEPFLQSLKARPAD